MNKKSPLFRKKTVLLVICAIGVLLAGLAIAKAPVISLNSPASFPVDI